MLTTGLQRGMEVGCWLVDALQGCLLTHNFRAGLLQPAAGRVSGKPVPCRYAEHLVNYPQLLPSACVTSAYQGHAQSFCLTRQHPKRGSPAALLFLLLLGLDSWSSVG